jgi:methyl-accepting chemotaxis protein
VWRDQDEEIESLCVINRRGEVIACHAPKETDQARHVETASRFFQTLMTRQSRGPAGDSKGWMVWTTNQTEYLAGYVHVGTGSAAGATAIALKPTSKAFVPIYELRAKYLEFGVGLAVLVMVISRFIARRLSQPINVLTTNAESVAAGRFLLTGCPCHDLMKSGRWRGPSNA